MRRSGSTLLALGALLAAAAPATAAPPARDHALPLHGLARLLSDPRTGHVFASGGKADSGVLELDGEGRLVRTLRGSGGAYGLALGGSTLYVLRCDRGVIDAYDTRRGALVESFAAPETRDSCDLALAGGRLWYTTDRQHGELRSVDVAAPHAAVATGILLWEPIFATSAARPGLLVAGDAYTTGASVTVLDVTGQVPSVVASHENPGGAEGITDLALDPAGSRVLIAPGAPYHAISLPLADLAGTARTFETGPYPSAVAPAPDGATLGVGLYAPYDPDVLLFPAAGGAVRMRRDFGVEGNAALLDRGLAWATRSRTLLAVASARNGTATMVHVIDPAARRAPITVRVPRSTVPAGQRVRVTVAMGRAHAGERVVLVAHPASGGAFDVGAARLGRGGSATIGARPDITTTYAVRYDGAVHYLATTSRGVRVRVRAVLAVRLGGGYGTDRRGVLYRYDPRCWTDEARCPAIVLTARPTAVGGPVSLAVQRLEGRRWRTLSTASGAFGGFYRWRYSGPGWVGSFRVTATIPNAAWYLGTTGSARFAITR